MSGSVKSTVVRKTEMSALSKAYLTFYNSVQTVGWSYVFFQSIRFLLKNKTAIGLWDQHGTSLLAFQSLAALEVLHCIVGLVPSNVFLTFIQVGSRLLQAWGIIYSVPEVQNSPTVAVVILAWGLTEVIRYSFYCTNLLGRTSSFLTWCRYSLFLGLYPAGVFGEVGTIVQALGTIKRQQLYSVSLPNVANISFSYYYANLFFILTYIPLFPKLFNHMRNQRSKVLGQGRKTLISHENIKKAI